MDKSVLKGCGCLAFGGLVIVGAGINAWKKGSADALPTASTAAPVATVQASVQTSAAPSLADISPFLVPVASGSPAANEVVAKSKAAVRHWFERLDIQFADSPLIDGMPRLLGRHADKLTTVELIGRGDHLERGSVTLALVQDQPEAMVRNTAILMVFMRETGWEKGTDWATNAMVKKGGVTTHGMVRYEVISVVDGLFVISAEPKARVK